MMKNALVLSVAIAVAPAPALAESSSRKTELHVILRQAVMLHASVSRHVDLDYPSGNPTVDAASEVSIDLAHMELLGGYFETCVYEPGKVRALRLMVAYGRMLQVLGYSDAQVKATLMRQAGERAGEVEQLLDYAGLDGVAHFICLDYMLDRLRDGMPAEDLRRYIDEIPDS